MKKLLGIILLSLAVALSGCMDESSNISLNGSNLEKFVVKGGKYYYKWNINSKNFHIKFQIEK